MATIARCIRSHRHADGKLSAFRQTTAPDQPAREQSDVPSDTVQSKLPNPDWLEHWLDQQIKFDKVWEGKVVSMLLKNMSILFGRPFETTKTCRYRKEISAAA